jgi:hypothetical protein
MGDRYWMKVDAMWNSAPDIGIGSSRMIPDDSVYRTLRDDLKTLLKSSKEKAEHKVFDFIKRQSVESRRISLLWTIDECVNCDHDDVKQFLYKFISEQF